MGGHNHVTIVYVSGVMGRSDRKVEASHPICNLDLKTRMQIMAGGIQFLPPTRRRLRDAFVHHAIASLRRFPFRDVCLAANPACTMIPPNGTPSLSHHQRALNLNHGTNMGSLAPVSPVSNLPELSLMPQHQCHISLDFGLEIL